MNLTHAQIHDIQIAIAKAKCKYEYKLEASKHEDKKNFHAVNFYEDLVKRYSEIDEILGKEWRRLKDLEK